MTTNIWYTGWGWHWRRWIHLHEQGRLREDYDEHFVSPAHAQQLILGKASASSTPRLRNGSPVGRSLQERTKR